MYNVFIVSNKALSKSEFLLSYLKVGNHFTVYNVYEFLQIIPHHDLAFEM